MNCPICGEKTRVTGKKGTVRTRVCDSCLTKVKTREITLRVDVPEYLQRELEARNATGTEF